MAKRRNTRDKVHQKPVVFDLIKSYADQRKAQHTRQKLHQTITLPLEDQRPMSRDTIARTLAQFDLADPQGALDAVMGFLNQSPKAAHGASAVTIEDVLTVYIGNNHTINFTSPKNDEKRAIRKNLTARNRDLLAENSRVLIEVLQQVLDYKPRRGDNRPPPELWIDDSTYLEDVRKLVDELKRLNDFLEKRGKRSNATRSVLNLKKRADTFLTNYAATLGKGAGWLTIALLGTILYEAGLTTQIVTKFHGVLK